jgi:hypothetical protein
VGNRTGGRDAYGEGGPDIGFVDHPAHGWVHDGDGVGG